jgi:hypothetical protein
LLDHFPREQVLVLQFERCRANPAQMLDATFAFLGLDPSRYPSSIRLSEPRNANVREPAPVDAQVLAALPETYSADLRLLLHIAGDAIDPDLWPTFRRP